WFVPGKICSVPHLSLGETCSFRERFGECGIELLDNDTRRSSPRSPSQQPENQGKAFRHLAQADNKSAAGAGHGCGDPPALIHLLQCSTLTRKHGTLARQHEARKNVALNLHVTECGRKKQPQQSLARRIRNHVFRLPPRTSSKPLRRSHPRLLFAGL